MNFKKLISFLGVSLTGLHLFNRYTANHAKSLHKFNIYRDSMYKWQYGNIYYTKKGTGAPLLLIHDLSAGSSSYEWKDIIEYYAKMNTVYAIDLIGCGSSDKPNFNYTNFLFTKLVRDFITEVVQESCTIITSGNSSSIALMTNLLEENIINKIIMINPAHIDNCRYEEADKRKATLFSLPIIGTFLANHYNTRDAYEALFYTKYYHNPYNIKPEDIDAYYSSYHTGLHCSKAIYSSICNGYTNVDVSKALETLNVPLCIICGDSIDCPEDIIDSYRVYQHGLMSKVVPDAKYLPHLECPESVIKILDKMID